MGVHRKGAFPTAFRDDFDDLGYDLPRFLNQDRVADADVLFENERLVMQRGATHGRPRDEHRGKLGNGSQLTGAANLHGDVEQCCLFLLGRVFISSGPSRRAAGVAELLLGVPIDHLDDRAIRPIRERMPLGIETTHRGEDVVKRIGDPERFVFPDSGAIEQMVKVGNRADFTALDQPESMRDEVEGPFPDFT